MSELHNLVEALLTDPLTLPPPFVQLQRKGRKRRLRRRVLTGIVALALVATAVIIPLVAISKTHSLRVITSTPKPGVPPPPILPSPPPSAQSRLDSPAALAMAPQGGFLIANQGTNQILRETPDGQLQEMVGRGTAGYSGDTGPALNCEINHPSGIAVASDGTIYFADTGNNRVRAVSPQGVITTVAGNGIMGSAGGGRPGTEAELSQPQAGG